MRDNNRQLRIVPLGGLGEIGLNMMVIEQEEDAFIVDCGLMFPGDNLPGVDYIIPDFSYPLSIAEKIRAVVLTHGHEDHIGALPFLLRELVAPIYSTPLTLGLVKQKLSEFTLDKVSLEKVMAGDTIRLGAFEIEFIRVSHSIADCVALAVKTDMGVVIHTGDFKLDPQPIDGRRVDLGAFARYGDQGVLALLSDSTNVEVEGYTSSESEVGRAFQDILKDAPGRVIVAMFASNIHRMQQVFDAAAQNGRKVAVMGRSMLANSRIAEGLGYLDIPEGILVEPEFLSRYSDDRLVLLTTGTQGEPLSVLARMSRDEYKQVAIRQGDTVVLSSRFIPGNETAINRIINDLFRKGADVLYEKVSDIHVSGHASKEELKLMIALTRPQYFIPVHGEYRHLVRHARLAADMGIPDDHIMLIEDGDLVTFNEVGGERVGSVETGKQVVDGVCIADFEDIVFSERRKLGREGVVTVVARMDPITGRLMAPLHLESVGMFFRESPEKALDQARQYVESELFELDMASMTPDQRKEALRASLKRHIKKTLFRFPVIAPIIFDS